MLSNSMVQAGRIDSSVPTPYRDDPMMYSIVHSALISRHRSWSRELVNILSSVENGEANDI